MCKCLGIEEAWCKVKLVSDDNLMLLVLPKSINCTTLYEGFVVTGLYTTSLIT